MTEQMYQFISPLKGINYIFESLETLSLPTLYQLLLLLQFKKKKEKKTCMNLHAFTFFLNNIIFSSSVIFSFIQVVSFSNEIKLYRKCFKVYKWYHQLYFAQVLYHRYWHNAANFILQKCKWLGFSLMTFVFQVCVLYSS